MANWRHVTLQSTWANPRYRLAMMLAFGSSIAGGLGVMLVGIGYQYALYLIMIIHALFSHVIGFKLSHKQCNETSQK